MAIGAIVGSAVLGASSANKAAKAQTAAANNQIALQKQMYDQTREDLQPWVQSGETANSAANYLLGLGAAPTLEDGNAYSWEGSPGYQFQLGQGLSAVQNSAAAAGSLNSGRTLQALQEYGTGLANQDYYNNLNALMGMSSSGQNAAAQQANAGQNYATGASNALASIGNASAAGTIGVNNALQGGVNNLLGYQKYTSGLSSLYNSANGGGQVYSLSGLL